MAARRAHPSPARWRAISYKPMSISMLGNPVDVRPIRSHSQSRFRSWSAARSAPKWAWGGNIDGSARGFRPAGVAPFSAMVAPRRHRGPDVMCSGRVLQPRPVFPRLPGGLFLLARHRPRLPGHHDGALPDWWGVGDRDSPLPRSGCADAAVARLAVRAARLRA